ncbi:GNAT family N-acetyltransferase [Delftia acidovorans]|uniref:GNAT family N-acetyltransferase n=1 Tax=Delftia acidovorans TaxID=80866 RepID=UPI0022AB8A30|nr:GNAT family N-acetyltransferase [Delftia acidovorans]WAT83477.1 GNAT family N-acetyltransferase [Delftia acidovorans]WAT84378.1 GNAT family N-acetyltransferase [Delftia acidovorans]
MNDAQYQAHTVTDDELVRRVGGLFERNGNPKDANHLRWMYIDNSAEGALTNVAVSQSDEDAAVYSVFKVRVVVNGSEMVASQSVDTLTDKNHRGRGLFFKLAEAVYQEADNSGLAFVYGFPNSSSGPVFFSKLGWVESTPPPYLIYPSNLAYPLQRKFKWFPKIRLKNFLFSSLLGVKSLIGRNSELSIVDIQNFEGDGYSALWKKFSATFDVAVQRDAKYMQWRFINKPGNNYRIVGLLCGEQWLALAVYTVLEKHGGRIGYVMEFIHDPAYEQDAKQLMQHIVRQMNQQGADAILAWNRTTSAGHSIYKSALFMPLPRALQPIKLHFGFRPNPVIAAVDSLATSNFYISYADSDTV